MAGRDLIVAACCCCGLAACGSTGTGADTSRLKKIDAVYFVDDVPAGQPSPRLYAVVDGRRMLVDRQVLSWQSSSCLVYESVRPPSLRVVFAALPDKVPAVVATSDSFRPWRMAREGIRRFDEPRRELDGTTVLEMEFIDVNDMCNVAWRQPPFREGWNEENAAAIPALGVRSTRTTFDVHGTDSVGNTTLSLEVDKGHVDIVDELLRAGADVDAANDAGISPLMSAIAFNAKDTAIIERLLNAGADIEAQDKRGMTALMYAAYYRREDAAKILLARGASRAVRDNLGRSAAAFVRPEDQDLARMLGAR